MLLGEGESPMGSAPQYRKVVRSSGRIIGTATHTNHPDGSYATFSCGSCQASFRRRTAIVSHNRKYHGLPGGHTCMECGQVFGKKWNLHQHLDIHRVEKAYVCVCGRAFQQKPSLLSHRKICDLHVQQQHEKESAT